MKTDKTLDAKGLTCPMPLLKAKQVLNTMESGQSLKVEATDPGSVRDFKSYADLSGQRLLASYEENGHYVHIIEKS